MRSDWKRPEKWEGPREGEIRVKLTLSYDGSFFNGWQAQKNKKAVQNVLEDTLSDLLGKKTVVYGSGRTDSGVHAIAQVCHFDTSWDKDPALFRVILNTRLEKSIRIIKAEEADKNFHARYSTMSREYWYLVKEMTSMLPFDNNYFYSFPSEIDVKRLNEYAALFVGTHDFTTFASARDKGEGKKRDIYLSEWEEREDLFGFRFYVYKIAANAFLYHQVRSMVGTMLDAARKEEGVEDFKERLKSKNRKKALRTAPASGLYLKEVSYDSNRYLWFEEKYGKS